MAEDKDIVQVSGGSGFDPDSVVFGIMGKGHQTEYEFYSIDEPEELFGEYWPPEVDYSEEMVDILYNSEIEPDVIVEDVAFMAQADLSIR